MMIHKCDGCRYKSEHQEMGFRPFGVCTKETNIIKAEKAFNAEKCPYKQTNADRIRSMSDEELAEHNVRQTFMKASGRYSFGESYTDYLPAWGTSDGWQFLSKREATAHELEWLQQPAKECE